METSKAYFDDILSRLILVICFAYYIYLLYLCKQTDNTMEAKKLLDAAYNEPNEVTKAAIEEARSGKLRNVPPVDTSSVEAMFK